MKHREHKKYRELKENREHKRHSVLKSVVMILTVITLTFPTIVLSGCGNSDETTKVVLTTGFRENEVFKIETMVCTKAEIMVYITNIQNQYEAVFGSEIWKADLDGVTLEQNVKDTALAQIAQIKTMNLMAENYAVSLDEGELDKVDKAANSYYDSLSETEITQMGITLDTITQLYAQYALADKVYDYIIRDINPEISDDEARTITVQQVFIPTCDKDGTGARIEYGEAARQDAYNDAQEVYRRAALGEDFEELITEYSQSEKGTNSYGKGDMESSFETVAFNLETGEVSQVIETADGYYVIKCISTFDREQTDANKVKIVEKRKKEVFGENYDNYVASLTRNLNEKLWNSIEFIHDEEVTTNSYFETYAKWFD